ncbi:hypothetical protein [Salinisphaera hydrothermalis]|uniref:hypothetical protein n=1 Tax=Salinisphaera hydrothermalis TaxID=563188 RepID=UPI0033408388
MKTARRPGRGSTRRGAAVAVVLVLAMLGGSGTTLAAVASSASGGGPPNRLDPRDKQPVPGLLQDQQARYRHLAHIWNHRVVPTGLPGPKRAAGPRDSGVDAVGLEVHNVDFELGDGIGFYVKSLAGAMVPHKTGAPLDFDDPDSYDIHIHSGTVVIRPDDLDALFNRYVLTNEPRSLSSVSNHSRDGALEVDVGARLFGFIPPVSGLPTHLSGPIKISKDGWLVYTPDHVSSLGLPLLGLLKTTGLSLATITPLDQTGVQLEGNQLLMDPERLFPPPRLHIDHIKSATLSKAGLTLVFDSSKADPKFSKIPVSSDSYIWLQSGDARFFSTVLVNTRLLMKNIHGKRLHFNLYHYRAQTAAGRINGLMDGSLVVSVPNSFDTGDDADPSITENAKPDPN